MLLGICVSAVLGIDTRRTLAYQVFSILVSMLLISMIWGFFFRAKFKAKRILPVFGTSGELLSYQIIVKNLSKKIEKGFYLREELDDPRPDFETFIRTPEPGEEKRNFFDRHVGFYRWEWLINKKKGGKIFSAPVPDLLPGASSAVNMKIFPLKRGTLQFTGLTITCPDPLGLFNGISYITLSDSVVILPKRYSLPEIRLGGKRMYQSGGVALTSSVGDSEEFISLRDYRPGDPLKRIHWKSWAKTGKPVVKQFQGEFFVRHALILDTFQQPEYSDSFEEAVSLAASFALSVQTEESLLDLMFVGPKAYCFTSGRGLGHVDRTLEILASVTPCHDKSFSSLTAMVAQRGHALSGCILILINWDMQRKELVKWLAVRYVPAIVLLVAQQDIIAPEILDDARAWAVKTDGKFIILEPGKIKEGLALALGSRFCKL